MTNIMERHCSTGEPCAVKVASTVRGGAVGNGLTWILSEEASDKSKAENSTALAAYSTFGARLVAITRTGTSEGAERPAGEQQKLCFSSPV